MKHHMLMSPHETRASDQVINAPKDLVDEWIGRKSTMIGVVLDGESIHSEKDTQERTQKGDLIDDDELPKEECKSE